MILRALLCKKMLGGDDIETLQFGLKNDGDTLFVKPQKSFIRGFGNSRSTTTNV